MFPAEGASRSALGFPWILSSTRNTLMLYLASKRPVSCAVMQGPLGVRRHGGVWVQRSHQTPGRHTHPCDLCLYLKDHGSQRPLREGRPGGPWPVPCHVPAPGFITQEERKGDRQVACVAPRSAGTRHAQHFKTQSHAPPGSGAGDQKQPAWPSYACGVLFCKA